MVQLGTVAYMEFAMDGSAVGSELPLGDATAAIADDVPAAATAIVETAK